MSSPFTPIAILVCILLVVWVARQAINHHREAEKERDEAKKQYVDLLDFMNKLATRMGDSTSLHEAMQLVTSHLLLVLDAESAAVFIEVPIATTHGENAPSGEDKHTELVFQGAACAGLFPAFTQREIEHQMTLNAIEARPERRQEHFYKEVFTLGEGLLGKIVQSREPFLVENIGDCEWKDSLPRGISTMMAVPMTNNDHLVGLCCVVNRKKTTKSFCSKDIDNFVQLSSQATMAARLVQVYAKFANEQRLFQQMQFGKNLQMSLLPKKIPDWGAFRFAATYIPAQEVGGDYYDYIEIDEDRLLLVTADASGKGVSACMLMAMCRAFTRAFAANFIDLEHLLISLNKRLFEDTDRANFVTMAAVVVDRSTNICECGRAGHTPFLLRRYNGGCARLKPKGPALGMLPEKMASFGTVSFLVRSPVQILSFTDGFSEAQNEKGEQLGIEPIQKIWSQKHRTAEKTVKEIVKSTKSFSGDAEQADDQTLLVIDFVEDQEKQNKT